GDCRDVPRFAFAEPAKPPNGSYPVGASLRYKCRPGYTGASGKSPMVTCLPNSTWAADPDFCVGKLCSEPEIANGRFHYTDELRFGVTIYFMPAFGYRLVGESSAQCILSNNNVYWNAVPHCEIIPCEPPPVIANGQFGNMHTDYIFGSAVTYSCDKGFSLIGDTTIHCTVGDGFNGVWSGPAPECKEVRCQNPEVKNGKKLTSYVSEYVYGDTVTFECIPGYFLNGAHTVTCGADNTWKPPLPTCDPRYCGSPPDIPFAEVTGAVSSSFLAGTELTYRCYPGYATGDGMHLVVTCLSDTTWSKSSKLCTRQQCTALTIENGSVKGDDFLFGTTVMFSCNAGYELKGSSSAKCVASENGVVWNVTTPTCKRQLPDVLCGVPPAIDNGMHNGTRGANFAKGSIVVYKCNDGFTLAGGASIRCTVGEQHHGVWSTPTPECKRGANTIIVGILPLLLAMLVMNF
ncbi:CR1 protein, partial [Anseranas semipalmata]|nr:CR1 protein [Anseranas semipalmata]